MKTQRCCAYKSTLYHVILTETPHLTPIRPGARLWNEFHRCGSVSWQVTPPAWRRRDKDRRRAGWWRGHEGVKGGKGWRSDIRRIWAKREDIEREIRVWVMKWFLYAWGSRGLLKTEEISNHKLLLYLFLSVAIKSYLHIRRYKTSLVSL